MRLRRTGFPAAHAIAVAVTASLLGGCAPDGDTDPKPPEQTRAVTLAIMGGSLSDVAQWDTQLAFLRDVVVPRARRDSARLMVGLLSEASVTRARTIGDRSFDVSKEAGGNGVVETKLIKQRTKELLDEVALNLKSVQPSAISDPFGAVAWAEGILAQFTTADKKLLVMLNDGIATMPRCNLSGRQLSAPYDNLIADCAHGHVPVLAGVETWQSAALALDGEPLSTEFAIGLEGLWRQYWDAAGAHLTKYGPILVGSAPAKASHR